MKSFVDSLEQGATTLVRDHMETGFSGGQNQRLALARIFYHAKDIVIMDEATSSLDKDTENVIVENINKFKGKKTIIVITHKESTLKYVDKIFEINDKKLKTIDKKDNNFYS